MPAFINDHFVENDYAALPISDLAFQRGYAVFDFFRVVNGVPLYIQDHLSRFFASAAAMHLPVNKSREEIISILEELIFRSSLPEAGVRITLTGGFSADGYHPATPNLILTCQPVKPVTEADFEKGFSVITYAYQRELPHIKSINYLMAVWLQPHMKEKQADDVLYFNPKSITEFPRSNVFMVTKENTLVTPAHNILQGITRKNVLSLAQSIMPVEERDIPIDELMNASEVFLTATTKFILPVLKINGTPVGNSRPGKTTRLLYEKLLDLEKTYIQRVSR